MQRKWWESVEVSLISLKHLKANKKASGRLKDLTDLEYLPWSTSDDFDAEIAATRKNKRLIKFLGRVPPKPNRKMAFGSKW